MYYCRYPGPRKKRLGLKDHEEKGRYRTENILEACSANDEQEERRSVSTRAEAVPLALVAPGSELLSIVGDSLASHAIPGLEEPRQMRQKGHVPWAVRCRPYTIPFVKMLEVLIKDV